MYKLKMLCFVFAILFGLFLIVFGGYDDSPGAQGLGLMFIIVTVILAIRGRKKK